MRDFGSPYGDLIALQLSALVWGDTSGSGARRLLVTGDFAADQLDAAADATVQGGATFKPTFNSNEGEVKIGYEVTIAVPDFAIDKNQQGRLIDWTGEQGDLMDEDWAPLQHAILLENILVSLSGSTPGAAPALFGVSMKFRGYGAPVVADGSQTEDTPVAGVVLGGAQAAFVDMELDDVTFDPDGVARLQTLVMLPDTLYPGDIIEIKTYLEIAMASRTAIQWYGAKYRWVCGPFDINVNATTQLLGSANGEAGTQPRLDETTSEP